MLALHEALPPPIARRGRCPYIPSSDKPSRLRSFCRWPAASKSSRSRTPSPRSSRASIWAARTLKWALWTIWEEPVFETQDTDGNRERGQKMGRAAWGRPCWRPCANIGLKPADIGHRLGNARADGHSRGHVAGPPQFAWMVQFPYSRPGEPSLRRLAGHVRQRRQCGRLRRVLGRQAGGSSTAWCC